MKKLMLGNEAVARGLFEAGCRLVSSYPGTPSTEITEYAAEYNEIYAEWATNEKVALEVAVGASIAGGRAFCAMKHVGMNVAADPLFISSYTGVNGGLVIAVADDAGMHSSQNEQDSRHYAAAAKIPMLEPSDSEECLSYAKAAFDLSEQFDTPVIIRLNTRISHSQSIVETNERKEVELKKYVKNPSKWVMMPSNARGRHMVVEERLKEIRSYSENCFFNQIETNENAVTGIITAGPSYNYAHEVFGDSVSYLKLGMIFPLPEKTILEFASHYKRIIVIEELDDIIESHCRGLGLHVEGKNLLPFTGEFSQELIAEKILGKSAEFGSFGEDLPPRPPVLCPGCPHRGIFYVFKKMKLYVSGDIGCYTLGAVPPLNAMDTTLCMGASVSALHGYNKILGIESAKKSIAVIGDSTFMHSGMTGLVNIVYNKGISTVVIVDNSITGMTGHQENPCSGRTLKGETVSGIMLENIALASGVNKDHVIIVDPADLASVEAALRRELASDEPSVIIARRPCALLKYVRHGVPNMVDTDKCKGCRACMQVGCPCISMKNGKAEINTVLCTGCSLCSQLCRFGAISGGNE